MVRCRRGRGGEYPRRHDGVSASMNELRIAKYHGTGNDFVMIEDLEEGVELRPKLVAALCDRHLGVGADGVIRIARSDEADFFMDYANADGSVAEMCGNGIRCVGKLVY